MNFEITKNTLDKISADIVALPVFEGKEKMVPTAQYTHLDKRLKGLISDALISEAFSGKAKSIVSLRFPKNILNAKVVVFGLGKKEEFTLDILRKAYASIAKTCNKKADSLALSLLTQGELSSTISDQAQAMVEAVMLGCYSFIKYKKKEKHERNFSTVIISHSTKSEHKEIKEGLARGQLFSQATVLARDLVNEQSSIATPLHLAKIALEIGRAHKNIRVKVYDQQDIEKMGMGAFLGVARGANIPPKFIFFEYLPKIASKRKVALVGKGITFDTGGINVKPEGYMTDMKMDMAGAAAVLGVFSVINKINPSVGVIGCIAATPNVISGDSIVPGDVVTAINGKTIEVLHTDAEGRVTLADSLSFAVKQKATEIIDLATLTGACLVALGTEIAGLMTNDQKLAGQVKQAAVATGERVWELPLPEDYKDLNKSEVADISNLPSSRWAGAITAGLFLQEFVKDTPWVHLDIAGPAFAEKEHAMGPKGGTGYGVRLLLTMIENMSKEKI